jgi:hypothetical protein
LLKGPPSQQLLKKKQTSQPNKQQTNPSQLHQPTKKQAQLDKKIRIQLQQERKLNTTTYLCAKKGK